MNQSFAFNPNNDNYTTRDIMKIIFRMSNLFFSYLTQILFFAIFFALLGLSISYLSKVNYKAELRFIVKSEGTGSGMMSGMLGGLGAMLGGSTMGSPLERTVEIVSSDRILGSALLSTCIIDGRQEILANHMIRINNLSSYWSRDSALNSVKFTSIDTSIEAMSLSKRRAIKKLENMLIPKQGNGIISKAFDKKSGVVSLSAVYHDEEFAILITKAIFNKLRDFYIEQMVTSAANNVIVLQKKVDSIRLELNSVQSSYARRTDQSFGLLFQEDKVELKKLAVREQMLMAMYAEAQKNLETFKFMNDSAIPSLTVIDMPYSPLKKIEKSKILYTTGGFFLGGLLSFIIIAIRRWYNSNMSF